MPVQGKAAVSEKKRRQAEFIENSFGKDILNFLADATVNEIYVNDDRFLRIDTIYGRKIQIFVLMRLISAVFVKVFLAITIKS